VFKEEGGVVEIFRIHCSFQPLWYRLHKFLPCFSFLSNFFYCVIRLPILREWLKHLRNTITLCLIRIVLV